MNNTTNEQNTTADSNLLDSLLDQLAALPDTQFAALFLAVAGGVFAYFRVAAVRVLVAKLLRRYEPEIDALIDEFLTKAQTKAFEKLDSTLQKQVRDDVLRDVILSAYDQRDDALKKQVRSDVRAALAKARGET